MNKKNYNPFKMWGSYVGLIILGIFGFQFCLDLGFTGSCPSFLGLFKTQMAYLRFIIFGVVGFLIGYGIHSLISY